MKKLFLLFVCLFTLQLALRADDDQPIQVNQLPEQAQLFIKQYFVGNQVAIAKMESDWLNKNYDVIFTNGDKVEFDKRGNWTEVNCKYSSVPLPIIPVAILRYITTHYPGVKVLKIDRDKRDYEVKLANMWELKFDLQFRLIDLED